MISTIIKVTAEKNVKKIGLKYLHPFIRNHYVNRIEKNGRTKKELHQVIEWLTGFDDSQLQALIDDKVSLKRRFLKKQKFILMYI